MNIKKRSIIIPAFALLIGTALAGSISGTVAWYQYSTRVNAAYVGTSAGVSGNLQIRFDGQGDDDWVTRLTYNDVDNYLYDNNTQPDIIPVTSGNMDKDDAVPATLYKNPTIGESDYTKWAQADSATNYVVLPLELRYVEREDGVESNAARNIYLSDLLIQKDPTNNVAREDISDAIRVHISAGQNNFLISNKGETINTNGKLDLDGDGENDKAYGANDKYGFNGTSLEEITYGTGTQTAYKPSDLLVTPNDDLSLDDVSDEKIIGKTVDGGVLDVVVTIWVEGWQEFDNNAIWDSNYIMSSFDVGFEFAVDPAE